MALWGEGKRNTLNILRIRKILRVFDFSGPLNAQHLNLNILNRVSGNQSIAFGNDAPPSKEVYLGGGGDRKQPAHQGFVMVIRTNHISVFPTQVECEETHVRVAVFAGHMSRKPPFLVHGHTAQLHELVDRPHRQIRGEGILGPRATCHVSL
jgi:hypothetical protein